MPRWLLAFALVGAALAELFGRFPGSADAFDAESTEILIVVALLYPGFLPLGVWLSAEWWVANELLVHYLGVAANAAVFAALGAWLFDRRASPPHTRFGIPLASWVFYSWFCLEGALRFRLLVGL